MAWRICSNHREVTANVSVHFSALELDLNLEALNPTAKSSASERPHCTATASTVKRQQKHTSFLALFRTGGACLYVSVLTVKGLMPVPPEKASLKECDILCLRYI